MLKSVKSHLTEFEEVLLKDPCCKTFSFIDKMASLILVEIFMLFTCSEKMLFYKSFIFTKICSWI